MTRKRVAVVEGFGRLEAFFPKSCILRNAFGHCQPGSDAVMRRVAAVVQSPLRGGMRSEGRFGLWKTQAPSGELFFFSRACAHLHRESANHDHHPASWTFHPDRPDQPEPPPLQQQRDLVDPLYHLADALHVAAGAPKPENEVPEYREEEAGCASA